MTYEEPIKRVDGFTRNGKATHWYEDATGKRIPGVTTIIGDGLPKPALVGWGIKSVAEFAVDNWSDLNDLPPTEMLKRLKGSPYAERDKAARRGTEVHALAEELAWGRPVDVPPELDGHVRSYLDFLDTWEPTPIVTESVVYDMEAGYAGSLDMIADVAGERWLLDVKTTRSGVYGDTAFQLAAYRYATWMLDQGDEVAGGKGHPMIPVDRCGVIHVTATGYALVPVKADLEVYDQFLSIREVAIAGKSSRGYVGQPMERVTA
jgi:hypothetical protein